MTRTAVYIDGANLFYRVKGTPFRWLDPEKLVLQQLKAHNRITKIRYFSAHVSGRDDLDRPRRQAAYLSALKTLPVVELHFGRFLSKVITRPLVTPVAGLPKFVDVATYEEKGSDVNLATHLLHDGWCGRYDVAVVISNDTDLCEPIRIVSTELKKPVGILCPAARCAKDLRGVASFVKHISNADLVASQFPNTIVDAAGTVLASKPATWT